MDTKEWFQMKKKELKEDMIEFGDSVEEISSTEKYRDPDDIYLEWEIKVTMRRK